MGVATISFLLGDVRTVVGTARPKYHYGRLTSITNRLCFHSGLFETARELEASAFKEQVPLPSSLSVSAQTF